MMPESTKKVEKFESCAQNIPNSNNYLLLEQNKSNNNSNCNNILLTLGLIILIFLLWMKYSY